MNSPRTRTELVDFYIPIPSPVLAQNLGSVIRWMDEWIDGRVGGWMDGWMDGWLIDD